MSISPVVSSGIKAASKALGLVGKTKSVGFKSLGGPLPPKPMRVLPEFIGGNPVRRLIKEEFERMSIHLFA